MFKRKKNQPQPMSQKNFCEVGERVRTKYFSLSVNSLNQLIGNPYITVDEDYEIIEVVITIENTSNNPIKIRPENFEAKLDGTTIEENDDCRIISTNVSMTGMLENGQKIIGSLCYKVPIGWEILAIETTIGRELLIPIKILVSNR